MDGFWVHYSSEKFERMARETMEVRLRMINESNKSIGSTASYSVRDRVLIISHFTFRDIVACSFFPTTFLEIAVYSWRQ